MDEPPAKRRVIVLSKDSHDTASKQLPPVPLPADFPSHLFQPSADPNEFIVPTPLQLTNELQLLPSFRVKMSFFAPDSRLFEQLPTTYEVKACVRSLLREHCNLLVTEVQALDIKAVTMESTKQHKHASSSSATSMLDDLLSTLPSSAADHDPDLQLPKAAHSQSGNEWHATAIVETIHVKLWKTFVSCLKQVNTSICNIPIKVTSVGLAQRDWQQERKDWERKFFSSTPIVLSKHDTTSSSASKRKEEAAQESTRLQQVFAKFDAAASGYRPDTILIRRVPKKWFGVAENMELVEQRVGKVREEMENKVLSECFSKIAPVTRWSAENVNGVKSKTGAIVDLNDLECDLWVQFPDYTSLLNAYPTLHNKTLKHVVSGFSVHLDISLDNSRYLSDKQIRHRKEERERIRRQAQEKKEREERERVERERRKEQERLAAIKRAEEEAAREAEYQRRKSEEKAKRDEEKRAKEEEEKRKRAEEKAKREEEKRQREAERRKKEEERRVKEAEDKREREEAERVRREKEKEALRLQREKEAEERRIREEAERVERQRVEELARVEAEKQRLIDLEAKMKAAAVEAIRMAQQRKKEADEERKRKEIEAVETQKREAEERFRLQALASVRKDRYDPTSSAAYGSYSRYLAERAADRELMLSDLEFREQRYKHVPGKRPAFYQYLDLIEFSLEELEKMFGRSAPLPKKRKVAAADSPTASPNDAGSSVGTVSRVGKFTVALKSRAAVAAQRKAEQAAAAEEEEQIRRAKARGTYSVVVEKEGDEAAEDADSEQLVVSVSMDTEDEPHDRFRPQQSQSRSRSRSRSRSSSPLTKASPQRTRSVSSSPGRYVPEEAAISDSD